MHGQNFLLNQPLAIDKSYLMSLVPNFILGYKQNSFLSAEKIDEKFLSKINSQYTAATNSGANKYPVVIEIIGPIVKYSDWYYTGTQTILNVLKSIEANENVSGVIFKIDSGGGMAWGTPELANYIFNMEKMTIGYTNGLACSAALWIMAACKLRIASPYANWIGSIGTFISYQDFSALFEKYGAKIYEIYAPESTEKNMDFRELMKGNEKPYEASLKVTNDLFISNIKTFYGESLQDDTHVFKGKVYTPSEAKKIGLIDEIGTFEDAISKF